MRVDGSRGVLVFRPEDIAVAGSVTHIFGPACEVLASQVERIPGVRRMGSGERDWYAWTPSLAEAVVVVTPTIDVPRVLGFKASRRIQVEDGPDGRPQMTLVKERWSASQGRTYTLQDDGSWAQVQRVGDLG